MVKKGYVLLAIVATLAFVAPFFFGDQIAVGAEKVCRLEQLHVVRITGSAGKDACPKVEPRDIEIASGSCVVWVNWIKDTEIKVVFEEGKVCHDVTRAPASFKMDAKNCYVTNYIE